MRLLIQTTAESNPDAWASSLGSLYKNASFGSHDKPLLVCRGLLTTYEKPTMNSEYEFIVATPAISIGSGEVENVIGRADCLVKGLLCE